MIKKIISEVHELTWTLGGTGLVLITLSGQTRSLGIWITGVSIVVHMVGVLIKDRGSKKGEE
jgi:hypothetical protein